MKKKEIAVLSMLVLLVICVNVHFLNMKSGYYVDEGMTLFLANGHYNGAVTSKSELGISDFIRKYIIKTDNGPIDVIENIYGMLVELVNVGNYSYEGTVKWYDDARNMIQGNVTWMKGRDLYNEIVAETGARFQYVQVYLNQALDVHPCVYYILVHTVFSLFPDMYSDVFLFAINIAFLVGTCVLSYRMLRRFCNNRYAPWLSVIIYGFSQGLSSCAVYFRMYAMLCFFVILTLYMHMDVMGKDNVEDANKKNWIKLGLSVWLGFNTHYYYIIFLAPLFVLTCIHIHGKTKILKSYIKTMFFTGIISIIIWPFSLYHILFGYRGTEALANIMSGGILRRLLAYFGEFAKAFSYGWIWCIFAISLFIAVVFVIMICEKKIGSYFAMITTIPGLFYLLVIAQISPEISDRYIMCLFPICAMLMAVALSEVLEKLFHSSRCIYFFLTLICIGFMFGDVFYTTPNYLYLERKEEKSALYDDIEKYNCVMVGLTHGQGFAEVQKLSKYGNVIVAGEDEVQDITDPEEHGEIGTVVYIYEHIDVDECLKKVENNMGINTSYIEVESNIESFRAFVYRK